MARKLSKSAQIAHDFIAFARKLGWQPSVRTIGGDIKNATVTIQKAIAPNCNESFSAADWQYHAILSILPQTRPGSIWGTDGGSVGGYSAMRHGVFFMNMTGVDVRVLRALDKALLDKALKS